MQMLSNELPGRSGETVPPDYLPEGWFAVATALYPGLTAPGVWRARTRAGSAANLSDSELERAALAELCAAESAGAEG